MFSVRVLAPLPPFISISLSPPLLFFPPLVIHIFLKASNQAHGDRFTTLVYQTIFKYPWGTDVCKDSVPIEFNTADKRDGHWNYVSSFDKVQFESDNIMNTQKAIEGGVPDIVIIDIDGSSDPAKEATGASSFVTDKPQLTAFASRCTSYPRGMAYCEGSCLRTVTLYFDQTDTKDYSVKFTRQDGKVAFGVGFYRYDNDAHLSQYENNERSISIPLPSGKYKVEFFDGEELVWPKLVFEKWGK
jgi:hypothetical protein